MFLWLGSQALPSEPKIKQQQRGKERLNWVECGMNVLKLTHKRFCQKHFCLKEKREAHGNTSVLLE